ncbi:MAG: ShlB/FhaC/HecB family hemolysin secretion/activation protein [Rhodocyclaceae bacterium]|nr:ShlB/FhaC/HecB family hemolysin secretion/activation protein [Rhodocyclaceae bacterium]MBX3669872.1 ShlB/FhaC/HecB family hemolysin secretion/activation protein [Rhodocyclaceae bacterium]
MSRLRPLLFVLALGSQAVPAADSAGLQFPVRGYTVRGATVFTAPQIEALLAPYTGPARGFADVESARAALQAAYQQAGWGAAVVNIPEQDIEDGSIRLQVLEPRLKSLDIQGNARFDTANIAASLSALQVGSMPNTGHLERQVALVNENPAKHTEATLQSTGETGLISAAVQVTENDPWQRFISLDNSGSPETGEYRIAAGLQYANAFNRDQVATLQYTTSPSKPSKVHIFGAGYRIPLYELGDAIEFVAGYSSVDSGTVQGLFNVSGNGRLFGARYVHYLRREGGYTQRLTLRADWRDFTSDIDFQGRPLGNRVLVHPLSAAYTGGWRGEAHELGFTADIAHNLPGGRHGHDEHFQAARAGARAAYTALHLDAHATFDLPRDWQVRANFQSQYSRDALVSGEQFGLGGADSIRGMRERALANDKGFRFGADLYTPSYTAQQDLRLRGVAFYDCGRLWRNEAQPGEVQRQGVASIGLGLRLDYSSRLRLRVDWAHLLKGNDTPGSSVQTGDERIHASLVLSF